MQGKKQIARTAAFGCFDGEERYAEAANCGLFRLKKGGFTNMAAIMPNIGKLVENHFIRIF